MEDALEAASRLECRLEVEKKEREKRGVSVNEVTHAEGHGEIEELKKSDRRIEGMCRQHVSADH